MAVETDLEIHNTMRRTIQFLIVAAMLAGAAGRCPQAAERPLRDGDRIVFVGDSITGLGVNHVQGFVHLIEWRCARPGPTTP